MKWAIGEWDILNHTNEPVTVYYKITDGECLKYYKGSLDKRLKPVSSIQDYMFVKYENDLNTYTFYDSHYTDYILVIVESKNKDIGVISSDILRKRSRML